MDLDIWCYIKLIWPIQYFFFLDNSILKQRSLSLVRFKRSISPCRLRLFWTTCDNCFHNNFRHNIVMQPWLISALNNNFVGSYSSDMKCVFSYWNKHFSYSILIMIVHFFPPVVLLHQRQWWYFCIVHTYVSMWLEHNVNQIPLVVLVHWMPTIEIWGSNEAGGKMRACNYYLVYHVYLLYEAKKKMKKLHIQFLYYIWAFQ